VPDPLYSGAEYQL